jgi:hypothetical protein
MQTHTAPVNTDKSANKPGRISGKASAHAACKHNQPGCSHMRAAGLGPSMDAVIFGCGLASFLPSKIQNPTSMMVLACGFVY